MTERPIIFSAPMVKALLAGRKSQTRRLATSPLAKTKVGDMLWVRECFTTLPAEMQAQPGGGYLHIPQSTLYGVDFVGFDKPERDWNWSSSIHMPRWASRLTLAVAKVRLERLHEMTAHSAGTFNAQAEGIDVAPLSPEAAVRAFADLWNSLHAKPGTTWDDNPDVVAITFCVRQGNIDEQEAAE